MVAQTSPFQVARARMPEGLSRTGQRLGLGPFGREMNSVLWMACQQRHSTGWTSVLERWLWGGVGEAVWSPCGGLRGRNHTAPVGWARQVLRGGCSGWELPALWSSTLSLPASVLCGPPEVCISALGARSIYLPFVDTCSSIVECYVSAFNS